MTIFNLLALLLFYLCNSVLSMYIQTKRFDYDPSPVLMYNQMYSHRNWRPYDYDNSRSREEDVPSNWYDWEDVGRTIDKRVTADQINSLLKNAWLGR